MLSAKTCNRLSKDYRIEYGPFSSLFSEDNLKTTRVKNVSASGVLFSADEELQLGSKIVLSIHVTGWRQEDLTSKPIPENASVLQLKAIAEVVRVERDPESGSYRTGARFVGRVH